MTVRAPAKRKSGKRAGTGSMAAGSAALKRIAGTKRSAPSRKALPAKKTTAKKAPPARKPVPVKKPVAPKVAAVKPAPAAAKPAAAASAAAPGVAAPAEPGGVAAPRTAPSSASVEERRKAATRKFFARLRSLEAIVGADLRKRGSVVLMQAVDQWYNEAISAGATDVSITNAAKVVISQL
jgi:hypothetical protein